MEQEKEEHQQTKERGLVILTGVGHVGRQAILAHMLMEKMNHPIDIMVHDLDEVTVPRMQGNPQDLFVFIDIHNIIESDPNRTIRERLLHDSFSEEYIEDIISLVVEQRKRRKDFAYIVNDTGSIENSLLHMKAIVETFFQIPAPVP